MSTLVAFASILADKLDNHIHLVLEVIQASVNEKDAIEIFIDSLEIFVILFKSCKQGTGR
jgi:hypothetical protein